MAKIKLTESNLKKIVSETVKKMLNEATSRTKDYYFGGYLFVGVGRTKNGVPVYYSDHLPIEVKRQLGWRKSAKYGMCGQADEWTVCHVLKELGLPFGNEREEYYNSLNETISPDYRSSLKSLLTKSFSNLDDNEKQFLYDLLNNETWETVYVALETLKPYNPNKVNEGKNVFSMDLIYNQVLERIVDFLECGDMEIKFGNMNEQSFDVYLPLSEKYLEISYMGKTINMPLNKHVEDLSDESIARIIIKGFAKLYSN